MVKTWQQRILEGDSRMPSVIVQAEIDELRAKLADQTKAADHWMGEACKSHNDLVRANEKLAEFLAQKPVAWLYEVNGRIKLETKRLDNYYWMGEGDSWVKGKPLILAAGAAPAAKVPDCANLRTAPDCLNMNDAAMWATGWNDCRDSMLKAAAIGEKMP